MILRPPPERGPFTEDDLPAIEAEMRAIIARNEPFVREVWSREQLIAALEGHRARRSRPSGRPSCPTARS